MAPSPEVTARTERSLKGVPTRRIRRLGRRDGTVWRGIPLTTVPATLVRVSSALLSFDEARRRGDTMRRNSWRDIFEVPAELLIELRELLQASTRPRLIA